MDAQELREALDRLPAISGMANDRHSIPADRLLIVADAARTVALPILENGYGLVFGVLDADAWEVGLNHAAKKQLTTDILAALIPVSEPSSV